MMKKISTGEAIEHRDIDVLLLSAGDGTFFPEGRDAPGGLLRGFLQFLVGD